MRAFETFHVSLSSIEIGLAILNDHELERGIEARFGLSYVLIREFK